jgi:hypothetical protein
MTKARGLAAGFRISIGELIDRIRRGSGAYRDRTDDLRLAKAALSQLS